LLQEVRINWASLTVSRSFHIRLPYVSQTKLNLVTFPPTYKPYRPVFRCLPKKVTRFPPAPFFPDSFFAWKLKFNSRNSFTLKLSMSPHKIVISFLRVPLLRLLLLGAYFKGTFSFLSIAIFYYLLQPKDSAEEYYRAFQPNLSPSFVGHGSGQRPIGKRNVKAVAGICVHPPLITTFLPGLSVSMERFV